MKLSLDEKDELRSLLEHSGYRVLLKEMEAVLSTMQGEMVKLDSESVTDRQLLIKKAHIEGAAKFKAALSQRLSTLKAKQER